MNVVFCVIFTLSTAAILFASPESFLSCLLTGAENSVKTALTLFCVYAVWMGLSAVAEESGLNRKISKLFVPLCGKLFRTKNQKATQDIAMNLTCNLIGIGGAATPFAVKAIEKLEEDGNDFAQKLLFIINATSIQILPTTVIALRAAAGSGAPNDIILPSLIASGISTAFAVALYLITRLNGAVVFGRKTAARAKKKRRGAGV